MKFKVLKFMTRRSEAMKPYEVGSEITLNDTESADLLTYGFIEKLPTPKTKGNDSNKKV